MKFQRPFFALLLFFTLTVSFCSCERARFDYKEVTMSANVNTLTEELGSKPDEETNSADGSTAYVYKGTKYLDYVGTMEYHQAGDIMTYSQWSYAAKKTASIEKAYYAICKDMENKYGTGVENEEATSVTFDTEEKIIVVAYSTDENTKNVCITTLMKK